MPNRRQWMTGLLAAGAAWNPRREGAAEGFVFRPEEKLIPAPSDPADYPEFLELLREWRQQKRRQLAFDDSLYGRSEFAWARCCYCCCFLLLYDLAIFDPEDLRYRVEEFVQESRSSFGGFDAVVLWHAYPRIGLDLRNQYDFYRDMPGGLEGLRNVVTAFHRLGLRALINYNPWDTGTRREGCSDVEALVRLVDSLEADGIFLDTLHQGAGELRARLDATRSGVVLESELALPLEGIRDHHLSWAQWFESGESPGVLRNKWFERRHMQHQIDRWNRDHSGELHSAWMNGSGILVWENVFGSWNGWNSHDRAMLRFMLPIQRRFSDQLSGEAWNPVVPTLAPRVFAGEWAGAATRLLTLVNRDEAESVGPLLQLQLSPGDVVLDLLTGRPAMTAGSGNSMTILGRIPGRGLSGFLVGPSTAVAAAAEGLPRDQARGFSLDRAFPVRVVRQVPAPDVIAVEVPPEMAAIPGGRVVQQFCFRVRECGFHGNTHPSLTGSGGHPLHHVQWFWREAVLPPYAISLTPVTNAQFSDFLRGSGYRPKVRENFLSHWKNGSFPAEFADHPVVYVSLEDARAFARWVGGRLPTEVEWQYAAQGPEALVYPWGNQMLPGRCNDGEAGSTTPVHAFPNGRSHFGPWDFCGNVWEWTESEHSDGRTRFAILKGGSYYQAKGSDWYMDGGPQPSAFSAKMLLLWPGLDRCATVGFRCAVSLAKDASRASGLR